MSLASVVRKALQRMGFPSGGSSLLTMPRSDYSFSKDVNGYQSAIIMACVSWVQRTFPEAPLYLRQRKGNGSWDNIYDHELLTLLETPNPYYDGSLLQQAMIADFNIDGNAYWRKIRSGGKRVVQLWWIPSALIEPKWGDAWTSSSTFISHYEYSTGGSPEKIDPADIVHFRNGIDPNNVRKGLSPLKSLFREVFTDDEAANMTAALLRNMGVPGVVISPKDTNTQQSQQSADNVKDWFKTMYTKDRRGEPLVMSGATEIGQFGFSPQQLDMKALRRIPEERISGVLGIPAIVAGLGAGLDRSTFANMSEAREMAYESNIIPTQRTIGSVIRRQLLSEFEQDIIGWQVAYDLSEVRILQEDENKKAQRVGQMVKDGFVTVSDAQRETGMPVDETQNIYLRPLNLLEIPSGVKGKALGGAEMKSADNAEEIKAILWKRVDRQRQSWWGKYESLISPLYTKEGEAVVKAVGGSKSLKFTIASLVALAKKAIDKLKPEWTMTIQSTNDSIVSEFGKSTAENIPDFVFDPTTPAIADWVKAHAAESVMSIAETNLEDVKKIIAKGMEANQSNAQIAKEIKQFYSDRSAYKAMRVARTETGAAAGYGQHESALQSGIMKVHTWVTSRDDRVRDSHAWLDGETRPIDEKFSNGLLYPGDTSGDPAEFIQCRCVEMQDTGRV